MKSLSLLVYSRRIFSLRNEWACSSSELFWERKRGERKCLAWSADSPLFIFFWEFRKSANSAVIEFPSTYWPQYLCIAWKSWHISQPKTTSQRRLGFLIPWMAFHNTADSLTCSFSVSFLLMRNNAWTMHKHFEGTRTMAQLRSDCSSICGQVTQRSWCFASQESDRWKYIIMDFGVVAIVKFFTLLHTLLENSD